ncbi:MAG: tRNA modification GTPase [Planctomycetes bacterium]|nr:tRNA modification GTPase [Planctomycetota bacterium]
MMLDKLDDTIVAVSTPPGRGQRGIVRLSGPQSLAIAAKMFRPDHEARLQEQGANVRIPGRAALRDDDFVLPAELFVFYAPRSYTRENVVELHTVGAPAVLTLVVDRAVALGARLADPGEFTARAFFHGAMDLTQVEGVAALIQARSDLQLRAAHEWLDGHLASDVRDIREQLADLLSRVEAEIDFADEPTQFIQADELRRGLDGMVGRLTELLRDSGACERVNYLPRVMLIGVPNAGKSTLMNRLSGVNRAVCSPIAGTTRDFLSAVVELPSGEIELLDTAGIGTKFEKTEKFSKIFLDREIPHVDLVCHLLDLTQLPLEKQVRAAVLSRGGPVLWVANKADLVRPEVIQKVRADFEFRFGAPLHVVSAAEPEGISSLRRALESQLFASDYSVGNQRLTTNARHRGSIAGALESLHRARQWCGAGADVGASAERLAFDLRSALEELGLIFGRVTAQELLDHIFSRFCIGK